MALGRFVLLSDVSVPWPSTWSEVVNQAGNSPITTPAVPASGTAQYNNTGGPVVVTVTGGTVSAISVSGTATGLTSGPITVPAGGTITITYTVAPTWTWAPLTGGSGGSGSAVNVSGTAPAGGQAGLIPLFLWRRGTIIYADSSAGSGAAQLLYQAIGAGNLRAYADTDAVGHDGLSN